MAINAADFVAQPYVGSSAKTRNKAIDPKLEAILAQVAKETGVTFVVTSGGQDAKGTKNARRTGSTRHDHGGAADVKAKDANGNFIDFSTDAGKRQWSQIVRLARAAGATGIGAGSDYMGTQTVHIGFGNPAVWSSTASGQPVEPWLQAAYTAGTRTPPMNIPVVASQLSVTPTGRAIDPAVQDQLRAAGFSPGTSDGVNGSRTQAAVKAFQAKNGLTVDGIVGPQTLAALQRATAASSSASSPSPSRSADVAHQSASDDGVADVQMFLKSQGFDPGQVDGVNGARTKAAVRAFQEANGLTADGIVGPQTYAAMQRATAQQQPSYQSPIGRDAAWVAQGPDMAALANVNNAFMARQVLTSPQVRMPLARPPQLLNSFNPVDVTINGGKQAPAPKPKPKPTVTNKAGAERTKATGAAGQPIYVAPNQSNSFVQQVTRPSNVPGVESFTGTVEQGSGGQNRYGSTGHNELLRQFT